MRVRQAFPRMMLNEGIFNALQSFGVPWADLNISAQLDMAYFNHSASKTVTRFVKFLVNTEASTYRQLIAQQLTTIYNDKWSRLWALGVIEYNPMDTEAYTETETIEGSNTQEGTDTGTVRHDIDGTNTGTINTTNSQTTTNTGTVGDSITQSTTNTGTVSNSGTNTTNENLFGFNSVESVGANTANGTDSNTRTDNLSESVTGTTTRTDNLNEQLTGTVGETRNLVNSTDDLETRNLASTSEGSHTETRTVERMGRSGSQVSGTRPQDLILAERELWMWNYFYDVVFPDIDDYMCLDVYESEEDTYTISD